jgi:hypothetical protein
MTNKLDLLIASLTGIADGYMNPAFVPIMFKTSRGSQILSRCQIGTGSST